MDSAKARRELGWRPRHDALATLRETIATRVRA
jgi:nucleoside-diphosphate-sugar epimerase